MISLHWTLIAAVAAALFLLAGAAAAFVSRVTRRRAAVLARQAQADLGRASTATVNLETVTAEIGERLGLYQCQVADFYGQLMKLSQDDDGRWAELGSLASEVLRSTLGLAGEVSHAAVRVREVNSQLLAFTQVRTDALTDVGNAQLFEEQLQLLIALKDRYAQPVSLAVLDIDDFRRLNETHGHSTGDTILEQFGRLVAARARETDVVSRRAADDFVVILPLTSLEGAGRFGDLLRAKVAELNWDGIDLTISVAVASARAGEDAGGLLERAYQALSKAKAGGGNCVAVHTGTDIEDVCLLSPEETDRECGEVPAAECELQGAK